MFLRGGMRDERGQSRRRDLIILLMLALLILMAWGVRSQPAGGSSADVAAKVNGVPITTLELNRSFQAHVQVPYSTVQEDPRAKEVLRQILDNLIDRELLLQRAKSLKMAVPVATSRYPDAAAAEAFSVSRGVRASLDGAKPHHGRGEEGCRKSAAAAAVSPEGNPR